uniref:Uncharacterized protein n=1 Tax=Rhizophora mucronata TaxID=61149 RepID=A0A2P2NFP2_RHIMU
MGCEILFPANIILMFSRKDPLEIPSLSFEKTSTNSQVQSERICVLINVEKIN